MDRALISAHGKLVAIVASVLQGAGVTTTSEFARLLALLSETAGGDDPDEAEILALWAATVAAMRPDPKH